MSAYYHLIYLCVIAILSFFMIHKYSNFQHERLFYSDNESNLMPIFIIASLFILFIGLRDPYSDYFGDSQAYTFFYERNLGDDFSVEWDEYNPLFQGSFMLFSSLDIPIKFFYVFIATIYFGGIAYSCYKFFSKDSVAAFLVYVAAFSTYTFSVNGIKAGAAASLFLVALSLTIKEVKIWPWVFLALSLGFHHSMKVPIAAFVICKFIKEPKLYLCFWSLCFIVAALHLTYFQYLFTSFGDEKTMAYLGRESIRNEFEILGGFRIDFILYSMMPLVIGWYGLYKLHIRSESYTFLLNVYTLVNAIWMLCIYAPFTNRIAYLSWLMYPVVLIYPLLKTNWGVRQYRLFGIIAMLHLFFTLFMYFI